MYLDARENFKKISSPSSRIISRNLLRLHLFSPSFLYLMNYEYLLAWGFGFRDYFRNYIILRLSCVYLVFLSQIFHHFDSTCTCNFELDPNIDRNGTRNHSFGEIRVCLM
jgi:hypothetical protein